MKPVDRRTLLSWMRFAPAVAVVPLAVKESLVPVGTDNMGKNVIAQRLTGTGIIDPGHTHNLPCHTHTLPTSQLPMHTHGFTLPRFLPGDMISSNSFNTAFTDLEREIGELKRRVSELEQGMA